jgi:hypothetical protein
VNNQIINHAPPCFADMAGARDFIVPTPTRSSQPSLL